MSRRVTLHSVGWWIVSCSVVCIGTSFALAQRDAEPPPEPPSEERDAAPPQRDADDEPRPERADERPESFQRPDRERRDESGDRTERSRDRGDRRDEPGDREGERGERPGQLGVTFDETDELVVREVAPGSAAAKAGIRAQDRIVSVNGREVTGQRRFAAFLSGMEGRRVPVIIERNGRRYTVQLTGGGSGEGPWLGVYLQDNEESEQGATVTHVYPASPAARAGLRAGDVILGVNEKQVDNTPDLIALLDEFQPKDKVTLQLRRGDQELEAPAVLAQRSDFSYQTSFDERDEGRGQQDDEEDPFGNIPPYAMQLEHDRRMAEQHERMEKELRKLHEEVRLLREAIEKK
jgi:hypothetical protein